MAYSADTFVADEQPTTAKWNKLWANDAAFNDGTGIANAAITASHISGISKANLTTDVNVYKARAYANTNQSISDVTSTRITFGTESYDSNNNFASNQYTVPVSGFYMINAGVRLSTTKGVSYQLDVKNNGTIFASRLESPYPSVTTFGDVSLEYSDIVQLTATNVIDFFATVDTSDSSAANIIGAASVSHTFCSFALLCRT